MKIRPACAAVVSIGTALLLLSGIRCAQAAEIKIVSPGAYEDIEGEGAVGADCCPPFRYQQVFPAADFAALGNQPHWIVDFTSRPDQSVTSPGTVLFPDNEIRLSTTQRGPANLSLVFDDNLGPDVMQFYRGPLTQVADVAGPGPGPREFYNADFPAGVTPFLYDPSQGNLLFDVIAWQGGSSSAREDKVPGMRTALVCVRPTRNARRSGRGFDLSVHVCSRPGCPSHRPRCSCSDWQPGASCRSLLDGPAGPRAGDAVYSPMPRCSCFKRKDHHENQTSLCRRGRRMPLRASSIVGRRGHRLEQRHARCHPGGLDERDPGDAGHGDDAHRNLRCGELDR